MATLMTEADLVEGRKLAEKLIAHVEKMRPPAAVVGLAIALVAVTHLAECGPEASEGLFRASYERLGADARRGG